MNFLHEDYLVCLIILIQNNFDKPDKLKLLFDQLNIWKSTESNNEKGDLTIDGRMTESEFREYMNPNSPDSRNQKD